MMELWTGTPGSGKSLHLAHDVRENLRFNKRVISTCNINTGMCFMNHLQQFLFNVSKGKIDLHGYDKREKNFYYLPLEECHPKVFYEFAARFHVFGKEHQTIIYLDECVALFSPTVIGNNLKLWNEWDEFFRIHRHIGYDIVLIPQDKGLISRKVLKYAETEIKHYNKKHHGTLGFFLSLFLGGLFCYKTYWRGDKRIPIDQHFFTYKPFYGQMYNSYSYFNKKLLPYRKTWEEKEEKLRLLCVVLQSVIDRKNQFVLDDVKEVG